MNEVAACGERMERLDLKMSQLSKDKDTIETLISNAISKWRERD
jgi:chromosome segregation ATPase